MNNEQRLHIITEQLRSVIKCEGTLKIDDYQTAEDFVLDLDDRGLRAAMISKELNLVLDRIASMPDEVQLTLERALKKNDPMEAAKRMASTGHSDGVRRLMLKIRVEASFRIAEELTWCLKTLAQIKVTE